MNKEHTNTCFVCIHLATCYKIEHYGRDLETNMPCREYIGINDRVEVVRCKDCKHYDDEFNLCILRSEAPDPNPNSDFCGCEFTTHINDFCSWGKRKENYNG